MQFNFFKDYFKSDAKFIQKPNFIEEFRGQDGLMKYSLDKDLVFWNGKEQITIKAVDNNEVFISNLASIPTFLHSILKPDNKYIKYASCLHDGLYDDKDLASRVYADWMFLLAMKQEDCPLVLRWVLFLGVRLFGSSYR